MRHIWLSLIQVCCFLLMITLFTYAIPILKPNIIKNFWNDINNTLIKSENHKIHLKNELNANTTFEDNLLFNKHLCILPPIILLDFMNKTNKSPLNIINLNDQKSKQTINETLSYGFSKNNIFSEKNNFYVSADKIETTANIQESINPLESRINTAIPEPRMEKLVLNITESEYINNQPQFEVLPEPLSLQINREPLPIYPSYALFRQRSKVQKISSSNLERNVKESPVEQFLKSHLRTSTQNNYNKLLATYTSMKPAGYQFNSSDFSTSSNFNGYARPMTFQYLKSYISGIQSSNNKVINKKFTINPRIVQTNFDNKKQYDFKDFPKYTIENGIKYEHKIIWKYPDGKISEIPPMSNVNSYSEYVEQSKSNSVNINNMKLGNFNQFYPEISKQQQDIQGITYTSYSGNTQNNIYSQKPVQFPSVQEQSTVNHQSKDDPFVPYITKDIKNQYESLNSYNSDNYHGKYGLKQNSENDQDKVLINYKNQNNNYRKQVPLTKYINSDSDPLYTYQNEKEQEKLFISNRQINKGIVAKHSADLENYLLKSSSSAGTAVKSKLSMNKPKNYINTDYYQLLGHNSSISQYFKNHSILNAQTTFIQLGNSLIPVIILQADRILPVQSKLGTNINLKAILRQYLTQYATSISKSTQNINYNLGTSIHDGKFFTPHSNPIEDLKLLRESLLFLQQREYQDDKIIENSTHNYVKKIAEKKS